MGPKYLDVAGFDLRLGDVFDPEVSLAVVTRCLHVRYQ